MWDVCVWGVCGDKCGNEARIRLLRQNHCLLRSCLPRAHSTARCSRTLLHDAVDERPGCSGSRHSTSSPSGCPPDLKTRMKHQQLPGLCQINDSIQDVLNSITLASATHSAPRSTDCNDVIRREKQRERREPPKRFYFFFLSLTHSSTLPAYL